MDATHMSIGDLVLQGMTKSIEQAAQAAAQMVTKDQEGTPSDEQVAGLPSRMIYVRSVDLERRTADFIASTDAIDAYDEVVDQSNWILGRYKLNPIALWAHQSRELPIGVSTRVEVVAGKLECTIRFLTADKNPKAEQVWRMVRDGELKAVSVGFMPQTMRFEMRNGQELYVLSDNELHEISVCNIPANPEALAKMKAIAKFAPGPITLDWSMATRRAPNPDHPAAGAAVNPSSPEGAQESNMNEKEFQTALAAKESEIVDLKSKITVLTTDKHAVEERLVKSDERATAAEAQVTTLTASNKNAGDTIAKVLSVLGPKDDKETVVEAAERAAHDRVAAEVDKLVGIKLEAHEREDFISLAKTNRALFERMVANRKDLGIAGRVIEKSNDSPNVVRDAGGTDNGDDLNGLLEKSLAGKATQSAEPELADLLGT